MITSPPTITICRNIFDDINTWLDQHNKKELKIVNVFFSSRYYILNYNTTIEFEEIYIPNSSFPIRIPQDNEALHLLQQVRDESHRFAVTYHRKLRSKKIEESPLDNIVGIGKKRKIELLRHFGDLESIKNASIDEIKEVNGMNEKAANNVYEYFHKETND